MHSNEHICIVFYHSKIFLHYCAIPKEFLHQVLYLEYIYIYIYICVYVCVCSVYVCRPMYIIIKGQCQLLPFLKTVGSIPRGNVYIGLA